MKMIAEGSLIINNS